MVSKRTWLIFGILAGVLLLGSLSAPAVDSPGETTHAPIQYEVVWVSSEPVRSDGVLLVTNDLGYEIELEYARLQLASFELTACDHSHTSAPFWYVQKAWAGHGEEPLNPAKVIANETLHVLDLTKRQYDVRIDHAVYCSFHQVFGSSDPGVPVVDLRGRYRGPSSKSWQVFGVNSTSAYGENNVFEGTVTEGARVVLEYNADTILNGIAFEKIDDQAVARAVLQNIISHSSVTLR